MTTLLSIFGSGKMALIVAAIVAGIGFLWKIVAGIKKSGVNEQKVKDEEAQNENLKRAQAAIDASTRPVDSVSDPHNRDNQ